MVGQSSLIWFAVKEKSGEEKRKDYSTFWSEYERAQS